MATIRPYHIINNPYTFITDIGSADGVAFICITSGKKEKRIFKSFNDDFDKHSVDSEFLRLKNQYDFVDVKPFLYNKQSNNKGKPDGYIISYCRNGKQIRKKYTGITFQMAQKILENQIKISDILYLKQQLEECYKSIHSIEHEIEIKQMQISESSQKFFTTLAITGIVNNSGDNDDEK